MAKEKKIHHSFQGKMVAPPPDHDLSTRPRKTRPSEALKAAVQAALLLGVPAAQIAQQYGINPQTVRKWEAAFDISSPTKRRDSLSEMLMVFVEQELRSLTTVSIATSDEDWIKAQSAAELASFIGAKQDRLMEILAAYGKATMHRNQIGEERSESD